MLTPFDFALLALIALGMPLRAFAGMKRLRALAPADLPRARPGYHLRGILAQWTLTLLLAALWWWQKRPLAELWIVFRATPGLFGVLIGLGILVPVVLHQVRGIERHDPVAGTLRERLAAASHLLPHDAREWPLFAAFALTAGICEELLFRGFVTWVLVHLLGFWPGLALQAVCFGLAHAYQGRTGMLRTGFAGAFLTAVMLVTGSLWASMLFHALMDLYAGFLAIRLFEPEPRA